MLLTAALWRSNRICYLSGEFEPLVNSEGQDCEHGLSGDLRGATIVDRPEAEVIFEPRIDALHGSALAETLALGGVEFAVDGLVRQHCFQLARVLANRNLGVNGALALYRIDDGLVIQ